MILSKMGEGTFGQVLECLDNENLEHLGMMERLLGPLPQHIIIGAGLRAEKYFKRSAHLDWLEGPSSKESTRAIWKLPRLQSQNCKFKCFSGILCCLLCIGSLLTQPSIPTTDIPTTTTTTFENPKKNFKTQVKTPGVVARLMGLDSLPDPRKVFRRKEDQKEKKLIHVDGRPPNVIARLIGLDGLPSRQPLHRQHKGFSKTYRQWTASVSSQKDGKPYELQSNRKDSMGQQECKDEYEVLETSKVERSNRILSKMGEGTFGQVSECLDNENLEHLGMMERLLGPLPQHIIIGAGGCKLQRKYEGSLEITPPTGKMGEGTFGQVLECLDNENLEHLAMMERLLGPLPQHMIISADLPPKKSQNCKFKCFSGILCCLLCIGSLLTQPSVPTIDIPTTTTTTTFENTKKNFKTQVKTPGVVARLMGLDSLPDPRKGFRRKEDQKEKIHVDGRPPNVIARLMGLDGLLSQQPLHRQHKGFSKTYRQWTVSVSTQRDGKPYELRSNRKDSMVQQECKDEYEVLETSKVERSSYPAKKTINSNLSEADMTFIQQKFMAENGCYKFIPTVFGPNANWLVLSAFKRFKRTHHRTFGQVLECLDNENLEHLAMTERLLGPLPQHMIISADFRAEKYFKRSACLDWLEGASSKESTRAVWNLPRLQLGSRWEVLVML
ncbi:unnamed protein product [Camellia sinensis]